MAVIQAEVQQIRTRRVAFGEFGVKTGAAYARYDPSQGTLDEDDYVELFTLPVGARVLWFDISTAPFGEGVSVEIGDPGDDDRFVAALDVSGITVTPIIPSLDDTTFTEPETIRAKLIGGNPADTALLAVSCWFILSQQN